MSCVPIIMISAKSKEEHIVEGLVAGSNDYVVKPFGRQEILARISAHLRFRDAAFKAGEMVGGGGRGGVQCLPSSLSVTLKCTSANHGGFFPLLNVRAVCLLSYLSSVSDGG